MTTAHRLLCAALLALLPGCTQDGAGTPDEGARAGRAAQPTRPDRPYYEGTPRVQEDIGAFLARVPGASPRSWTAIAGRLVSYGEPAVPQMVAGLESPDEDVQIMAAYVLGMIQDPRALEALHAATTRGGDRLRYEAATAMLRMGDRRGLATMVAGLESADPLVRARAVLVLRERTGETLGYRADDKPVDRAAALARWRAWLARTGGVVLPTAKAER